MPKTRYARIRYMIIPEDRDSEIEYHICESLKQRDELFDHSMSIKPLLHFQNLTPRQFEVSTSPGWTHRPPPVIFDHRESFKKELEEGILCECDGEITSVEWGVYTIKCVMDSDYYTITGRPKKDDDYNLEAIKHDIMRVLDSYQFKHLFIDGNVEYPETQYRTVVVQMRIWRNTPLETEKATQTD